MDLKCAWWNTSLAPTSANERAKPADKKVALQVIGELLISRQVDLFGMCELSQAEIDWLGDHCAKLGYGVVSGVSRQGNSKTDTCLIYKIATLELILSKNIKVVKRSRGHKIAQRVELRWIEDGSIMSVFLSHWPSVLNINKGNPMRATHGDLLRDEVDSIFEGDPNANIILMGDYNDEPFDAPLSFNLAATRDRHLAAKNDCMIYNPFWNRIGNDRKYDVDPNLVGFCGTHFYAADPVDRWRTFDQIMVSSNLLKPPEWTLLEGSVEIINIPSFTSFVLDRKRIFDHFPVAVTIRRGNNG
jgi:hypothetical protein